MSGSLAIFCPYCNARGIEQPVLAPMTATARVVQAAAGEALDAPLHPSFLYRCERCGYAELHDRLLDAA